MLVVDGNNHEVFEVSEACVWQSLRKESVQVTFEEFERLTLTPSGLVRAGLFSNILQHVGAIVALKLKNTGFVWGARISVKHNGQLPRLPGAEFGGDLLVLWPTATSIQAFFELKEAQRRQGQQSAEANSQDTFPPQPSVSVVPHGSVLGPKDLSVARKLATHELTVGQRIFLACLPPTSTGFLRRQYRDRWATIMEQRDAREFAQLPATRTRQWRSSTSPRDFLATAAAKTRKRQARNGVAFDLPDEVLMHIVSMRLCEEMETADSTQSAIHTLLRVSRQFGRATRQALEAMQTRVRVACESLFQDRPAVSVMQVRRLLEGGGLPLRVALELRGPWYEYVRARHAQETAKEKGRATGPRIVV